MTNDRDELARIIDPENGALNYRARQTAVGIIKAGFKRSLKAPKLYVIERIVQKARKQKVSESYGLAREIHNELKKMIGAI